MKTIAFVAVLAVMLVASVAAANVKWEQLPGNDPALPSQDDPCQGWTGEAADDFYCTDGAPISTVEWWGIHVPPACAAPASFMIRFYADVPADPPIEPWSRPGGLLYEEECSVFTEVWEDEYQQYHYTQDLQVPFYQIAGQIYWISIQAIVCMPDVGWAWCECDPTYYWNDEAVWRSQNPDPNWFFPNWTPVSVYTGGVYYIELAFRLSSQEQPAPVEETHWGIIKALYR
jgi:hypothetical protein